MPMSARALVAAALLAFPASASAQSIEIGPGGVQISPYSRDHDRYEPRYRGRSAARYDCDALRRACLYKEELGEGGRGNCRTYRRYCGARID